MIHQSLITTEPDFRNLEPEWQALLPRTPADTIFLTWEWISTWWEVFGEGKLPRLLTFRKNNELVGIIPCYLRKRRLGPLGNIRELRFIGTGETVRSEYLDIICLPEYRDECLNLLADFLLRNRDWDLAVFSDLKEDSALAGALPGRFPRGEIINREPCYSVKVPPDFETYLKGIDARMRRNIRNRRRNLERDFHLEYHRLKPEENLEEWMGEFQRLHAARLKERGLPSKFSDPRYDRFHGEISRIFREKGYLFAADLRLNDKTVAARYNFSYNGIVYDYQTGFDPEFSRQGVMQALISYMIEDCAGGKIRKFDFLAGHEDYKRHFANAKTGIISFRLTNQTWKGNACGRLREAREWIAQKLK